MGEHLSEMESMVNRLAAMQAPVDACMQVAILLVSVLAEESLQSIFVSGNTRRAIGSAFLLPKKARRSAEGSSTFVSGNGSK